MHSPLQILRKIASERFVSVSKLKKLMRDRTAGWRQKITCWYDSFMPSLALLSEFINALESSSFERTSSRSAVSCISYLWKIPSNLWIENDRWDLARVDHLVYVFLEWRRSPPKFMCLSDRNDIRVFVFAWPTNLLWLWWITGGRWALPPPLCLYLRDTINVVDAIRLIVRSLGISHFSRALEPASEEIC